LTTDGKFGSPIKALAQVEETLPLKFPSVCVVEGFFISLREVKF